VGIERIPKQSTGPPGRRGDAAAERGAQQDDGLMCRLPWQNQC